MRAARYNPGMKLLGALSLVLLLLATPGAAQTTQPVRVVAIVDFVDETADGFLIQAPRLSEELQRLLTERAGGRLRVVPVETVRAAMRERNLGPRDLFGPNRSAEVAAAVGADWIVTGRWTHLDTDMERAAGMPFHPTGSALLEIRVLEVSSRRVLLNDSFSGFSAGLPGSFLLRFAAQQALFRAAERIARL